MKRLFCYSEYQWTFSIQISDYCTLTDERHRCILGAVSEIGAGNRALSLSLAKQVKQQLRKTPDYYK